MSLTKAILPLALALYLYGILAGSYAPLTELEAPIFTRNGPFFSTLLVAIGFMIRQNSWRLTSMQSIAMAALGMSIHFGEAAWLMGFDVAFNINDFLAGTALWGTGVFMWLLANPNMGDNRWVRAISSRMLGIYVSHLLLIIVMFNICGILGITGLSKDILTYSMTIILSFGLVVAIEKSPLRSVLLR
jgi:surface polysaccharide O-acyltransferase-like enzyme